MTVIDSPATAAHLPPVLTGGTPRLLAGAHATHPIGLAEHLAIHGPLRADAAATLAADVAAARLLGRGGAAFPVTVKLGSIRPGPEVRVLVNGSEGEPASMKDRTLMRLAPHLVLDGAVTVAAALGTDHVTLAVHDPDARRTLVAALEERDEHTTMRVVPVAGSFVGGEARALINGLSGRAPVPSGRRVLPTVEGLDGQPTFVSNVETFAQLGILARLGAAGYAALGTAAEPGTTLATVLGDVPRRGVLEVPHGTAVSTIVGGSGPALLGGYHGTWGPTDGLTVDRLALRAAGRTWGAGVVAVLPDTTCPLAEVARVARWLAAESVGQCGPCVFGLASIATDVTELAAGHRIDLGRLSQRLGLVRGRGACAHPDGAVGFVASALTTFVDDVVTHVDHGGCRRPDEHVLPTGGDRR